MASTLITPVADEGLGNSAYLVDLGGGQALDGGLVATMCGGVDRAATGASVLERAGLRQIAFVDGGPAAWAEVTGAAVEVSS